jgi:hypothetical protein
MIVSLNNKVDDDLATVPFVERNGYYRVGDKNFNFKINALEEATRTNQSIQWEFNTDAYRNLNWRKSSGASLSTLYRLRAEQLRNQYDYLVLAFSGGSDSYTVLRSFIDNNIHLDEIVCDWPLSQTEQLKISADASPENYNSEWALAIKPVLEYVQQHHPKIKITVTDSLQSLSNEDHEDTCTLTQIHNYVSIKRYRKILERIRTLSDQHRNVALVLGIDKPRMYVDKNVFCVYFSDAACWIKSSIGKYTRNVEYFYWTPNMPEIVLEQAHTIYQHVLQNKNSVAFLTSSEHNRDFVKSLIYPLWNPKIFQANKGSSLIYNEQYAWFFSKQKTIEIQSWESSMTTRLNLVDSKYLDFFNDRRFLGYKECYSRRYPLGIV